MTTIQANTLSHAWRGPEGQRGGFRPNGKLLLVGPQAAVRNPALWDSQDPMLAARLFVGFNVGGDPTWSIDDLVPIVEETRKAQGHDPDSSFLMQKGIYTSQKDRSTVIEDGAQVIVLNLSNDEPKDFEREMVALAEEIAEKLEQEVVILEIQKGGITQRTFAVAP